MKSKVMHGQYIISKVRQLISEEGMFLWLSKGDLKAETDSEHMGTRPGITKNKSCNRNITNRHMANAGHVKFWRDCRPYYITNSVLKKKTYCILMNAR
jgi:hypothetical protein